ncbi:ZMYND12, partial [Symbiodinium microadriaticum]
VMPLRAPLFRGWAGAAPAKLKTNGARPAPYGLDFEEGQDEGLTSTVRDTFFEGFSEERARRLHELTPAGVAPKDGRTAAEATTHSAWDSPDWKGLSTNYKSSSDQSALARYHRRQLKARVMNQESREKRWVQCFKKWNHGRDADDTTLVSTTDFSILPAGWRLDGRPLPQGILQQPKATGEAFREQAAAKAAAAEAKRKEHEEQAGALGPAVASLLREAEEACLEDHLRCESTPRTARAALPRRSSTPSQPGSVSARGSSDCRPHSVAGRDYSRLLGSIDPVSPLAEHGHYDRHTELHCDEIRSRPNTRASFKKAGNWRYAETPSGRTTPSTPDCNSTRYHNAPRRFRRIQGWAADEVDRPCSSTAFSSIA